MRSGRLHEGHRRLRMQHRIGVNDTVERSSFLPPRLARWGLVGPAFFGVVAHLATLPNGFVFDDWDAIRDNPVVQGRLDPSALLHRDFWGRLPGAPGGVGTWRPLVVLSLWLDHHVGGGGPLAFHVSNLLFHATAVFAFTLALSHHLRNRMLAIVAGSLFAVFAVCTEGVASIVGRADTLATAFAFLAFAALPSRDETPRARQFALAAIALLAALLCKEAAIAAPAWMLLADRWLTRDVLPEPARRRRAAMIVGMTLGALGMYLALRLPTFGGTAPLLRSYNNNPLLDASLPTRVITALGLLGFSVQLTILPLQLAPDYSFAEILPSTSLWHTGPLAGLAVLAGLVALAIGARRNAPAASVGAAMFLVPWFAVSNTVVLLPTIFAERLLYAPAAGIALLLASGDRALRKRDRGLLASALLTVMLAANLARSVLRDLDWHDSLTLFTQAVVDTPQCARSWDNLGAARLKAHQPESALRALGRATEIAPQWASPYVLMGRALDEVGQPDRAEQALRHAIALEPSNAIAHFDLAVFLARNRRFAEALEVARAGLAVRPDDQRLQGIARRIAIDLRNSQPP